MQEQNPTSEKSLVPGWILGLLALGIFSVGIYAIDLFLSAYQSATIINRLEHHLAAKSSAIDISNDETLALVINEQNEATWKLLRRLAVIESGSSKGLNENRKSSKKTKQEESNNSEIDRLIQQQETLSNMAESLAASIQAEVGNLLSFTRLTRLIQRSSLLISLRKSQFDASAEISSRATALKDSTREELLRSARPIISTNQATAYNMLRPLLEPIVGTLPEVKQPLS